nr:MAG TPA: hypothetical protein [Caudoviricetes sp.]
MNIHPLVRTLRCWFPNPLYFHYTTSITSVGSNKGSKGLPAIKEIICSEYFYFDDALLINCH